MSDRLTAAAQAPGNAAGSAAVQPGFDAFSKSYEAGTPQVVWTRLVADLETPVSAFLKLAHERPNSFLLESVEGGAARGRYSIIGCDPDAIWRAESESATICRDPETGEFEAESLPPLDSLRALLAESKIALPAELPPMAAGVFGYMGYDTVRLVENLPNDKPDPLGLPTSLMVRPKLIVVFDSVRDEMIVVTPVRPADGVEPRAAYDAAAARLDEALNRLEQPLPHMPAPETEGVHPEPVPVTAPEAYMQKVERAKEYITAGDIFQVVLSQRFEAPFPLPSFALYRALRRVNPSPYLYYLNFGDFAVVGSSPEILVRVSDGVATIRPIAGTRPRGKTPDEDKALAEELLADAKERAEHLMLLDLGRNDVGRVAEVGTVEVTDSFFLEYYSQVMHIVSNVQGKLSSDYDAVDALMAGFPAGTVSGAPKVRAMEIIDELEDEKRGPYAGCVGYFSAGGEMDSCIVLRTSVVKDGKMYVQAGAGLVADSVPENEQAECVNKAKALFQAAEEAVRFSERAKRGS
ncbi:anthranilate synthase component I [Methyloligella sp. 2.7D]|uniref:anthranilate synthase component I n=1 Tax=unclassified Methyloligella TaxID=2625955 RepID=UPI00157CF7D0|nr:anthranilate synthase component I [Methyloligella sp. GL2]QKP77506.1 anthranilate synthase component I [Methyloligella sp. GL2]